MGDQAKGLGLSVAYVSAIERGKRAIPEDYSSNLSEWMSLSEQDSRILREIASGERTVVRVFPKSREGALLAEDFARDLNGLSSEAVGRLREVLQAARRGDYADDEVRRRAQLARAVFSLGEQISFNILRIIENQLPLIDPDFSLQVDPDGSLGEYLQIYSDSDGKTVNRFVTTEWLYTAAHRGTDDSRYKLAHELAHWILHRTQAHTFLRSARTNKALSKIHARVEREADLFAREFLMPFSLVSGYTSADALARAAQVPLWVARYRLREISSLKPARSHEAQKTATSFEQVLPSKRTCTTPVLPTLPTAEILPFPRTTAVQRAIGKRTLAPAGLPLFDYVDTKQQQKNTNARLRSDQWYTEHGWRG
jgi:hypothetical protein